MCRRDIKTYSNGAEIFYDDGKFDSWCVFVKPSHGKRIAIQDKTYFSWLNHFKEKYGSFKVFKDFVLIYSRTTRDFSLDVSDFINKIAATYDKNNNRDVYGANLMFTVLYAAMVAEENKERAILKKKIKRLGVTQLLFEGMSPEEAANASKGKKAGELIRMCAKRGF